MRPGYAEEFGCALPGERARLGAWAKTSFGSVRKLLAQEDQPLADSLDSAGVRGRIREEVFEPFFTGVLAEDRGETSSHFARLLVRSFARGTPGVPALGVSALPEQIAAELHHRVRLHAEVVSIERKRIWHVATREHRYDAHAVVVATDPARATDLVGVDTAAMKGLVTYWFATDESPTGLDLLVLDPMRTGPVVNTAVMSNIAPAYAPEGRHLVQATALAGQEAVAEEEVRAHLARMYRISTRQWEVVVAHHVPHALPEQRPGVSLRQPVDLGNGLFVAGDHRDTASIQGALVSGRRTAASVAAWLGRPD